MKIEKAGNMRVILFLQLIVILCGCSLGSYIITHSPGHTKFLSDGGPIDISEVPKVILSSYGFDSDLKWKGFAGGNLFKRPKANTVISVEGVDNFNIENNKVTYSLKNDISFVNTDQVRVALQSHVARGSVVVDFNEFERIYDIKSMLPGLFDDLPSSFSGLKREFTRGQSGISVQDMASLNITTDPDLVFLSEIYMLKGMMKSLMSQPQIGEDSQPDFYHLRVSGLTNLIKEHGKQSQQVKDAIALLQKTIAKLTSDFRKLYRDNVVIQVVSYINDENAPVRKARSLQAVPTVSPSPAGSIQAELNIARLYKENYPVMFNIYFWFVVAMALTILFVGIGIWFMDPGRDSIIYRMTSQRLKRE